MIALLDANLFVPTWVADPLLSLAEAHLYEPAWSQEIMDEAKRAIMKVRHASAARAEDYLSAVNQAFPFAKTDSRETADVDIELPDADDRHVAVSALQAGASVIVTYNLKDFPASALVPFGLHAESPDTFLTGIFDRHPHETLNAMRRLVASKHHPPRTMSEEIGRLQTLGLPSFAERLRTATRPFGREIPGVLA